MFINVRHSAQLAGCFAPQVGRIHLVLVEGTARKSSSALVGKTCTIKKTVFQDVPLAPSLSSIAPHRVLPAGLQPAAHQQEDRGASPSACSHAKPGEYVAVRIDSFSSSTLLGTAIARTTLVEFVRTFGGSVLHPSAAALATSALDPVLALDQQGPVARTSSAKC